MSGCEVQLCLPENSSSLEFELSTIGWFTKTESDKLAMQQRRKQKLINRSLLSIPRSYIFILPSLHFRLFIKFPYFTQNPANGKEFMKLFVLRKSTLKVPQSFSRHPSTGPVAIRWRSTFCSLPYFRINILAKKKKLNMLQTNEKQNSITVIGIELRNLLRRCLLFSCNFCATKKDLVQSSTLTLWDHGCIQSSLVKRTNYLNICRRIFYWNCKACNGSIHEVFGLWPDIMWPLFLKSSFRSEEIIASKTWGFWEKVLRYNIFRTIIIKENH